MTRDKKGLSQLDIKNINGIFLLMNDLFIQYPNVVVFGITNRWVLTFDSKVIFQLQFTNQPPILSRPWALDDGILRRFGNHIFVPKPGFQDRLSILRLNLTGHDGTLEVKEKHLSKMAEISKGLNSSDISKFHPNITLLLSLNCLKIITYIFFSQCL